MQFPLFPAGGWCSPAKPKEFETQDHHQEQEEAPHTPPPQSEHTAQSLPVPRGPEPHHTAETHRDAGQRRDPQTSDGEGGIQGVV